jgi:hypothetical protein
MAAVVGLISAVALPATTAEAASSPRYVSASTTVGSQVDHRVACPSGTRVTAGGVHIDGAGTDAHLSLAASLPWDGPDADTVPDDGWLGIANDEGNVPRKMTVFAICQASGSLSYISKSANLTGAGQEGEAVTCPAGRSVVGGGVSITGSTGTQNKVNSTYPEDGNDPDSRTDDIWHAYAINEIPGFTETMTVHAVCSSTGTFRYHSEFKPLPTGGQETVEAACPAGTEVVGGGVFNSGGGTDDVVVSSEPFDGPDADTERDDGWLGYGANGEGTSGFLSTYVVCATSGTFSRVSATTTLGVRMSLRATCPAGTSVTGGGVDLTHSATSPFLKLNSSEPFDGSDADTRRDDGWLASASNEGDPRETMTTWAVCVSSGGFRYVHGPTTSIPDGMRGVSKASCPAGSKVTGGGVHASGGDPDIEVNSTNPFDGPDPGTAADDAWTTTGDNFTGAPATITTYAVCATSGALRRVDSGGALPPFSEASRRVNCPAGTSVLGGGILIFAVGGKTQVFVGSTEPVDGGDADAKRDDGWLATATNESSSNQPMFVYAICLS